MFSDTVSDGSAIFDWIVAQPWSNGRVGATRIVVRQSLVLATGEELGWRGFLVPTLSRTMNFGPAALVSAAIWAAWHVPLIVFADYNSGTPAWYGVFWFGVMVVSLAVPLAWLRLRSGSVWPAAILHTSHNLFMQGFFDRVTVDTGPTRLLTGEFGAVLVFAIGVSSWLFWRARDAVPAANYAADMARPVVGQATA